jgi:hypothetical protein
MQNRCGVCEAMLTMLGTRCVKICDVIDTCIFYLCDMSTAQVAQSAAGFCGLKYLVGKAQFTN